MPENIPVNLQTQRQEQQLSARQLQSLELLQKPLPALMEELRAELESNPLLEADISGVEIPSGDPLSVSDPGEPEKYDDEPDAGLADDSEFQEELPLPPEIPANTAAHEGFFNSLAGEKTLAQQLSDELAVSGATPDLRELAESMIVALDEDGYLRTPLEDFATASQLPLEKMREALSLVQSLDPAGVGARTLEECLKLQIRRQHPSGSPLEKLTEFLPDIARNRLPQVAQAMNLSMEELRKLLGELRKLSPRPGAALSPVHAAYVIPEAEIVRGEDGLYHAVPSDRTFRLKISSSYARLLENPALSAEDRKYVQSKMHTATELIHSLALRGSTLCRIAEVIASEQKEFFDLGVEHLRPMTMRHAAEVLNLHEATVSRAASGKYVQTPRGIFEFRYFFQAGYESKGGDAVSGKSVQERIRRMIGGEDPSHPLSDDALSKMLASEGLAVARRTVAKYRDILGIPGTSIRRKH